MKELSLKASAPVRGINPYALVAFELEGQADGGAVEGRYLELGAAPGLSLAGLAVAVPVKVGLSLEGYYEGLRGDERFGFFSVGGQPHRAALERAIALRPMERSRRRGLCAAGRLQCAPAGREYQGHHFGRHRAQLLTAAPLVRLAEAHA